MSRILLSLNPRKDTASASQDLQTLHTFPLNFFQTHFHPFLLYFISHNQIPFSHYSVPAQHAVMSQIINKNIPQFPILPSSPTRNHHALPNPFLVEYTLLTGDLSEPHCLGAINLN